MILFYFLFIYFLIMQPPHQKKKYIVLYVRNIEGSIYIVLVLPVEV